MNDVLKDLAKAKAVFQQKAILSAMGVLQRDLVEAEVEQCATCGDHHELDAVPFICQTGDGV